jgi:xylan 1,4-beta-xylosidase
LKRNGWYYLITAEGGTGYGHCAAIARSRNVFGPYAPAPANPILTSVRENFAGTESGAFMLPEKYNPDAPLQKAGHGCLVETHTGEWYMVHLCARPVMPQLRSTLGRETAIQKMAWTEDGWLQMADGDCLAKGETPGMAGVPEQPFPREDPVTVFDAEALDPRYYTPRNEFAPDWVRWGPAAGGVLRLRGMESLAGVGRVSLVARVITAFRTTVTVKLSFEPDNYAQMAGIACYYDHESHYCAYKSYDEESGRQIVTAHGFVNNRMVDFGEKIPVESGRDVYLRLEYRTHTLRFLYSDDDAVYRPIGGEQDATVLSDEASGCGIFTGSFAGVFAQDNHTKSRWAAFHWFRMDMVINENLSIINDKGKGCCV